VISINLIGLRDCVTSLVYTSRSGILKFYNFNPLCWSFCKSNYVQMCAFCLFVHNAVGDSVYQCHVIIIFKCLVQSSALWMWNWL